MGISLAGLSAATTGRLRRIVTAAAVTAAALAATLAAAVRANLPALGLVPAVLATAEWFHVGRVTGLLDDADAARAGTLFLPLPVVLVAAAMVLLFVHIPAQRAWATPPLIVAGGVALAVVCAELSAERLGVAGIALVTYAVAVYALGLLLGSSIAVPVTIGLAATGVLSLQEAGHVNLTTIPLAFSAAACLTYAT